MVPLMVACLRMPWQGLYAPHLSSLRAGKTFIDMHDAGCQVL